MAWENLPSTNTPLNATNLLDNVYPVGSIYMSVNNTNPSTLFGGTWEQLKDRFLLSAGDEYSNGQTGGNTSHAHTLNNGFAKIIDSGDGYYSKGHSTDNWQATTKIDGTLSASSITLNYGVDLGGSTDSSSNLPPYLVVYMWKRTA